MEENSKISELKRKIETLDTENKRLRKCEDIIEAISKVHQALKARYVRFDEFVKSEGLQHIAITIFKFLDLTSLRNCCLVSKGWNDLIQNEKFWWCYQLMSFKSFRPLKSEDCDISFEELQPEITKTFEHICATEKLETLRSFVIFFGSYFRFSSSISIGQEIESPLFYAMFTQNLEALGVFSRTSIDRLNVKVLSFGLGYLEQRSVLGIAIRSNKIEVMEFFMNLKDGRRNEFVLRNAAGCTLFHNVCAFGSTEMVRLFLKNVENCDIELNAHCNSGMTPLMYAIWSPESTKLLLNDERIDVNERDESGTTALHYACETKFLKEENNKSHDNSSPCKGICDDFSKFEAILQCPRLDFNVFDFDGHTPLHTACIANCKLKVESLLKIANEKGIDVNARDIHGKTPLHYAYKEVNGRDFEMLPFSLSAYFPIAEAFLKYASKVPIDFEAVDNDGETFMHIMFKKRSHDYVTKFIEEAKNEFSVELDLTITNNNGLAPPEVEYEQN